MIVVLGNERERDLEHEDSEVVKAPDPCLCLPKLVAMGHMW